MSEIVRRTARSITEFIAIIDHLPTPDATGLWFRGQSNSAHRLVPGALRKTDIGTDGVGRPVRRGQVVHAYGSTVTGLDPERMLAEFKRQARPYLDREPRNDFEWMFVAQHQGLPTRLLDWSTNALVALYFAVSGARQRDMDGDAACRDYEDGDGNEFRDDGFCVFVIDPVAINKEIMVGDPDPIDVASNPGRWSAYLNPMGLGSDAYGPICVVAPHIDVRIRAQSGAFTLHGSNIWPIDYYDVLRPLVTKIYMPASAADGFRTSLKKFGMSESFIYPGLPSIARDVAAAEALRYGAERRRYLDSVERSDD